jgi:hypothetical protein
MSGIGSQGGFQAPHIPQKSAREAKQNGPAIAQTTKTITTPTAPVTAKPVVKEAPEQQIEIAQQKHSETVRDLRSSVADSRKRTDSFQKSLNSGNNSGETKNLSQFASKEEKDKELKQRATEFAKRINSQEASVSNLRKPSVDKPEVQQNHQIAAQAVQSQDDVSGGKKKSDKKTKNPLDAKLEKIFSLGGERGKKFVAFIQREQTKGPLLESTLELIDDFYLTIKGDSLSASELLASGEENVNLMRSMVSADNSSEVVSIQDALANSIANSAGERSDLLALRNVEKNKSRVAPPSPSQAPKKLPTELAIEFVSSIDFGVIKAPWDKALIAA